MGQAMNSTIAVAYVTTFLVDTLFYLLIGIGSIEYHIHLFASKSDNLMAFLRALRFPLSIYRLGLTMGVVDTLTTNPSRTKSMIARLIGTAIPLCWSVTTYANLVNRFPESAMLCALLSILTLLPIVPAWAFGRYLQTDLRSIRNE
ncbi:hypothetical protein ARNL5_00833 [Anaerolineae bacterium]|nr:hypothetical protein ARNL5_00833 [Anaerolineae bacterium]